MKQQHFSSRQAARAYREGRPYVHDKVMKRVRRFLDLKTPVTAALDVACGTGLSAVAMKGTADRIVALDVSLDMLSLAPRDEKICYMCAAAEALPFEHRVFDFVSVSSAYHWFDKKKFAAELTRVLKRDACAAVYETHFTGHLKGCLQFERWYQQGFRKRYPAPSRDYSFISGDFEALGIQYLGEEGFDYKVQFTAGEFVKHLLSMSNVTWAVRMGEETFPEICDWLSRGMDQFDILRNQDGSPCRGEFSFSGSIKYLRKLS